MDNARIDRIEAATLIGRRPREAGCNSRIPVHGAEVQVPVIRLTTAEGARGFGLGQTTEARAKALLGKPIKDLVSPNGGLKGGAGAFEFALWDLLGLLEGQPVYELAARAQNSAREKKGLGLPAGQCLRVPAGQCLRVPAGQCLRVPCYDTSLYLDDLHLPTDEAGAALIAEEARYGFEHNHRNFKIKVGRGARYMPLEAGTRRDIAVIKAVRAAVGADARIMIDANNGYNFNIAKRVLAETADCNLFWLEEAFHEDPALYEALRKWLDMESLAAYIADGEGWAAEALLDWARDGFIDVIQYDIFSHGFSNWLDTGALLDSWGARAAPHHYGRHLGNYVSGHLAVAIEGFTFVEWDETSTPGIDASAYRVEDGHVLIPDAPGFGLALEEDIFRAAVADGGFELRL